MNNSTEKIVKLVLAAMFAALGCVATMIIRIPTIGTSGYVNIGDTVVLLAAWVLGTFYVGDKKGKLVYENLFFAAAAAGLGPALADLIAGYTTYVPGTFVIKALMGVVAVLLFKIIAKANKHLAFVVSAVVAELVMVFGYFLYESTLLGYGMTAAASIPSNGVQGITCLVLGLVLVEVLNASNAFKSVLKVN